MVLIEFELKSYFQLRVYSDKIVENKTIYPHALSKKQFSSYCIFPTTIYNFLLVMWHIRLCILHLHKIVFFCCIAVLLMLNMNKNLEHELYFKTWKLFLKTLEFSLKLFQCLQLFSFVCNDVKTRVKMITWC